MSKFLLTYSFLFACCFSIGQNLDERLDDLISDKIEYESTQESFFARSIYKDQEGFIWMGLRNSLIKFDGNDQVEFSYHPEQNPGMLKMGASVITEDLEGNIWQGSYTGGLSKYDRASNIFYGFGPENGIEDDKISDIKIDEKGDVWISSFAGMLYKYDPLDHKFSSFEVKGIEDLRLGFLGKMAIDEDRDLIWIGNDAGMLAFDIEKETFKLYPLEKVLPRHYREWPRPVLLDKNDQIFYGHYNGGGIKLFDIESKEWTRTYTIDKEFDLTLGRTLILGLYPFQDSLILGVSLFNHLYLINSNDPSQFVIKPYQPMNENTQGFLVDEADQVWLGIRTRLNRFGDKERDGIDFFSFGDIIGRDGKGNFHSELVYDPTRASYLIPTRGGDGVLELDAKLDAIKIHRYKSAPGQDNIDIPMSGLVVLDENIWIASSEGLLHKEGDKSIRKFKLGNQEDSLLLSKPLMKCFIDGDGFWISPRSGGLVYFDQKFQGLKSFDDERLILSDFVVNEVRRIEDELLFVATTKGAFLYDLKSNTAKHNWIDEKTRKKIEAFSISDFEIENDTLWLGSKGNGLIKCVKTKAGYVGELKWSQSNLGSNIVNKTLITREGELWTASNYGFSFFDRTTELFHNFGIEDGIGFAPRGAVLEQLQSGEIMSSANNGFHYFDSKRFLNTIKEVKPYFKSIKVDDSLVYEREIEQLKLGADEDHLLIEMGGMNFNRNSSNYYRYQLEGYDKEWIETDQNARVSFTNLPGGSYQFKFQVSPKPGHWNEENKLINIEVATPFLESIFFKLLLGLLSLLVFWGAFKLTNAKRREQDLIAEQEAKLVLKEKERIEAEIISLRTQMNPHFLFNSLNSIKWFILKNKPKEASRYLSKFSKLIRLILDLSSSNLIPLSQELDCTKLYVDLESMRFLKEINYKLDFEQEISLDELMVPPLIIQPFVENAIWHGLTNMDGERKLWISVSKEDNFCVISIDDNGSGRDPKSAQLAKEKNRVSHGISITRKRIKNLGIEMDPVVIVDKVDGEGKALGTKVKVYLPWTPSN